MSPESASFISPAKHPLNWRNILWLFGTSGASLVGVPIALAVWGVTPLGLFLFLLSLLPAPLCITAGYHRLFSHRSYQARPALRLYYLVVGAAAFQGSALEWSNDHRVHHREVDSENDPYSINQGFFHAHMGWLFHQFVPLNLSDFPLDLVRDRLVMWQHRYYVPIAIGVGFGVPCLIGALLGNPLGGLLYGGMLRVVLNQHSTFLINSLSHSMGSRPFCLENSARDNLLMAFLAWGEGYHNFHHRFQSDYRNGFRWYHWDPTKWLIRSLSLIGLAGNLKRVPEVVIETTKIETAQAAMAARGIATDRLSTMREKALAAQVQWRTVYAEYLAFKKSVSSRSRARRLELRTEIKLARIEFRAACRQWWAYARSLRGIRVQSI
ncbi:MAG: fatty acid desaturase [Deltaproteobacteria bacterium]|nr:fatty acid desaturase [Deltaproteobacteria bacterium]